MLIQLKNTKHGAPFTDDEDVPENLRTTAATPKENEWDTDSLHFQRWDWILDEMIWSFEQMLGDNEKKFYTHEKCDEDADIEERMRGVKIDMVGLKIFETRKANGFKLFGKYFQGLWD